MKHQPVVVGQDVFCYAAYRNFIYRVYASHFQMSADRNTRDAMEKIGHHVGFTSVNLLKFLYQVEDSGFADTRMDEAVKVLARLPQGTNPQEFRRVYNNTRAQHTSHFITIHKVVVAMGGSRF